MLSLKDRAKKNSVARANFEFVEGCEGGFDTVLFPYG